MKTGILFDLDGTLLDTLQDIADSTNYTLAQFRHAPRTLREIRSYVGDGAEQLIQRAMDKEQVQQELSVFQAHYSAHCRDKTRPYEGILEALEQISRTCPVAIVSNKPDGAVKDLCKLYFPGIFARGEDTDCPRKPAPDMLFQALQAIGADRCIYVGDSEVDVRTAQNAGAQCLSVLWGFRDREDLEAAGARYFCADPSQLPAVIKQIEEDYGK